jgi:hypothetical protein
VADGHEQRYGIKIPLRDRTDGAVAIDEGMPHRVSATLERYLGPEVHGEVISEIAETTIVEIEEPGLSGFRPLGDDVH